MTERQRQTATNFLQKIDKLVYGSLVLLALERSADGLVTDLRVMQVRGV